MDVSPMSMQMLVPRAADATQVQHNLNQANALQQDFQSVQQKAEDKLKQEQVRGKDNPEDGRIREDPDHRQKQGESQSGQRRHEKQNDEEPVNYAVDPSRGHFLDISL